MSVTQSAAKAANGYMEPIMAALDENVRDARRAVVAARHAVEDRAAQTALQVRRHPFASIGIAVGAGALLGCVIGFTLGRRGDRAAP